ncbi:MAG: hypothetical protein ACFCD0_27720 [Gemmataceae bacterium]
MADKSTQFIIDGLSRAVLDPDGVLLHANKNAEGLFPTNAVGKQAAQRCLDEGYLQVVSQEAKGRGVHQLCAITEKGLAYLLAEANPKHVLEDFVRVLEAREAQVHELLSVAQHTRNSIESLRNVAERVLKAIETGPSTSGLNGSAGVLTNGHAARPWQETVLETLAQWNPHGTAGDCPLPVLYREVKPLQPDLSIGQFHDGLRRLHQDEKIYLLPWTGPLYDLAEPAFALLIGHEVLYYASHR